METPPRRPIAAFLLAAVAGAAIWALSPVLAGHAEPWDAGQYYLHFALATAGAVTGALTPRPLWAIYLGAVLGQALYEALAVGVDALFLLGLAFLLVYSLEFLAAAAVAGALRRLLRGTRPAP